MTMLVCLCLSWSTAQADEWRFSDVDRVVAIGDVHGAYDALVRTLQQAGVIDEHLAWSGGKAHLVFTGDLLDRGARSRDALDLVMQLERQAHGAGGRVHLLLGNHEVMNLTGDLRYVADEEYSAYLDIESAEERNSWYETFRRNRSEEGDEAALRLEFDEKAPPGFFGHRRAFRRDGVYGKWLLEKPFVIVVNDTAFVHGGLPPLIAEGGLAGANTGLKRQLQDYLQAREYLADVGVLSPIDRFKEIPAMLASNADAGLIPGEYAAAVRQVTELSKSPLHGSSGPTWYRGTSTCNELIESDVLDAAFGSIGANRVVLGHTSTITRNVQRRMNGRVVEIDTGMLKATYEGSGNALIMEGNELRVVNEDGRQELLPVERPVRVGHESLAITDAELVDILSTGEIADSVGGSAWRIVSVTKGEQSVFAYFRELPGDEHFVPEVAAYKLDRILALNMVPATVRRELSGIQGTLQFIPQGTMTERQRVAAGKGKSASCSVAKQVAAMNIFDALISNPRRTPSSIVFSTENWELMLIDHEEAFGAQAWSKEFFEDLDLAVGDRWRAALAGLTDDVLHAELGDVLDGDRLAALARRRDELVSWESK